MKLYISAKDPHPEMRDVGARRNKFRIRDSGTCASVYLLGTSLSYGFDEPVLTPLTGRIIELRDEILLKRRLTVIIATVLTNP